MDTKIENQSVCPGCGYPSYAGHSSQCPVVNQPRENAVTDLVLDNTKNYEELNATTLQEGEQKFTAALISALEKQEAEEKPLGMGSQSLVQRLKEAKGLVVKRLMFGKKLLGQGNLSPEQYFNHKKEEYSLVKKYFGSDFTPNTEFVEVNTNFNSPHPDTIVGHEYIMVQEELSGEDVSFQAGAEHSFDSNRVSPKLKQKLAEFIKRYREMQTGGKAVVEDQLKIDFDKGELYIQDTDFLPSYENFTSDNSFLEYIGQGGADISDVRSVIKLLGESIPTLADLKTISDEKLGEAIPLKETHNFVDAMSGLMKKLSKEGKTTEEKQKIVGDFSKLIAAIDYFPPTGDNVFVKGLKKAFHLEEVIAESTEDEQVPEHLRKFIIPHAAEGPNIHKLTVKETDFKMPVSFHIEGNNFYITGVQKENNKGAIVSGTISLDVAKMKHIKLDESLRGTGIGTAVLTDLEDQFKHQGIKTAYSAFAKTATVKFFLKNGYEIIPLASLTAEIKKRLDIDNEDFDQRVGNEESFINLSAQNTEFRKILMKKVITESTH